MPKDTRSLTERKAEQIMANKIMEATSKQNKCAHCGEEIGYYSLAGVTIRVDDLTWCDTVCHDDWMDAADAAQKEKDEFRERLADLCHRQWSGWMRYLFKKCEENKDGTVTIPKWAVERWSRQMETKYSQLSEDERNLDRTEADKFLTLIEQRG